MNNEQPDRTSRERRRFIARMAAGAAIGAGGLSGFMSRALAKGDLPAIPGVNQLKGTAMVNGRPAQVGTPVSARDKVSTGPGSMAIVVIRDDAFLVRENTTLEFAESGGVMSRILIQTGRVLSVFGKKPVVIKAGNATIGIRGTGAYLEVDPEKVYFCLCYGEAGIDGPGMSTKTVTTTHHEQPLVISQRGGIMDAEPGPFQNHSDDELILLESLVGREPPFKGNAAYPYSRQ
ncbi:MAG: FecR domain-containing protein [Betaproteobacteria bacterium]|nr:FecR domain-containing protein [Betaproteobacteria bacterium]